MATTIPLPAALVPAPLDDEALASAIEGEGDDAGPSRWRIEDDRAAEWAARKWAAAAGRLEEISDQAAEWHAPIDAWAQAESRAPQREVAFFEALLVDFARRRREADPKAKTLRLPSATVSSRGTDQPKAVVVDDDTVCNWLRGRALDAYFTVKYSPKRRELAESIEVKRVTGESGPCPTCADVNGEAPCATCDGVGVVTDPDYYVALLDGEEVAGVEVHEPTVSFTVKGGGA